MSFADIRHELETARRLPQAALRDAMAHVDELAPLVVELIGKVKAGVYLLPGQAQLLLYGVHVLAAARAAALWPAWCDLLRLPPEFTADLFGDEVVTIVITVTACLAGDDAPAIAVLLEDPGVSEDVRWALFPVLARMAWEGRADLADTRAFLERFAREELVEPEDSGWFGWIDAVRLLGLTDLMPLIEAVMAKPRLARFNAADRSDTLERLAAAAADFAAEGRFLEDQVAPFDDPVEGLWWQRSYQAHEDEWLAERAADEPDDEPPDPAADIALTEHEEDWLRGFLESRQVPLTTLDLETLDGFLCALVVERGTVPPSEYLPYVWGGDRPAAGPIYDGEVQQHFVEDLLSRYSSAIARRIADGAGHVPFLFAADDVERGRDWASGFGFAITLRETAWAPVMRRRKPGLLVSSILALWDSDEEPVAPDDRSAILDDLPDLVLALAEVFRRAGQEPVRSVKIGRNEPCPCGSGKKYKKCCGLLAAPR